MVTKKKGKAKSVKRKTPGKPAGKDLSPKLQEWLQGKGLDCIDVVTDHNAISEWCEWEASDRFEAFTGMTTQEFNALKMSERERLVDASSEANNKITETIKNATKNRRDLLKHQKDAELNKVYKNVIKWSSCAKKKAVLILHDNLKTATCLAERIFRKDWGVDKMPRLRLPTKALPHLHRFYDFIFVDDITQISYSEAMTLSSIVNSNDLLIRTYGYTKVIALKPVNTEPETPLEPYFEICIDICKSKESTIKQRKRNRAELKQRVKQREGIATTKEIMDWSNNEPTVDFKGNNELYKYAKKAFPAQMKGVKQEAFRKRLKPDVPFLVVDPGKGATKGYNKKLFNEYMVDRTSW